MKRILLIAIFTTVSILVFSQNLTQNVLWNHQSSFTAFGNFDQTTDSKGNTYHTGYVLPGYKTDVNPSPDTFFIQSSIGGSYILKLDKQGEFLWAKAFIGTSSFNSIKVHNDSIYGVGFYRDSLDLDPDTSRFMKYLSHPTNFGSIFYVILNSDGIFQNGNAITDIGNSSNTYISARNLEIGSNGSLNIFGTFKGNLDFNAHPIDSSIQQSNSIPQLGEDYYYLKLDSNLDFNFSKHWVNTSLFGGNMRTAIDNLDNCYLTGELTAPADVDPGPGINIVGFGKIDLQYLINTFLIKFDPNGNLQWAKSFNKISDKAGSSVSPGDLTIAPNNKIYLAGNFRDSVDFDPGSGVDLRVANKHSFYMAQFEPSGQLNWVKTLSPPSTSLWPLQVQSLTSDNSSNLYFSIGPITDSIDFDYTSNGTAFYDNLHPSIVKTDQNFNFQWLKELPGANYIRRLNFVNSSDTLYISGVFNDSLVIQTGTGNISMYNSSGGASATENFIAKCVAGPNTITSLDKLPFRFNTVEFKVYPNPTNGTITIKAEQNSIQNLSIRNSLGQLVTEKKLNNVTSYTLDIDGPSGLYFIELQDELGKRSSFKVIKE